jgi:hypothetical protein
MSRLEGFSYVGDKAPGARRRCAGQPATRSPQPATRPTDREREKPATTSNTASNTATTPSTTTLQSIDRSTRHTNLDQSIFFIIQVPSCSSFNIGYDETENGQGEGQQKEGKSRMTASSSASMIFSAERARTSLARSIVLACLSGSHSLGDVHIRI